IFWVNLENRGSGPPDDVFVQCCTSVDSLSFQPGTGTAFVVGGSGALQETLFTLNTDTGGLTPIGTFHPEGAAINYHLDIRALAWTEEPPTDAALISWWRAENNADDSADGNDGELENGATFAPGRVGIAFSFDGV